MSTNNNNMTIDEIREKLKGQSGAKLWASLEEVADTPEFDQWVSDEFPNRSSLTQLDRRDFLKFMGASMMLAGLAGCRYLPQERMVAYAKQPEDVVPGIPTQYCSTFVWHGFGEGILVESHMGRPGKIEGNPDHPSNRGASNYFMQAALLTMFDPDRRQGVMQRDVPNTWEAFVAAVRHHFSTSRGGTVILTSTVTSPTMLSQLRELQRRVGGIRWVQYDPCSREEIYAGSQLAFGKVMETTYAFEKAKVVVTLDSDFFRDIPGSLRYAGDFMSGRKIDGPGAESNRLYAFECTPTLVGGSADHRVRLSPMQLEDLANQLAFELGAGGRNSEIPGVSKELIAALVNDLQANKGQSIVIAGPNQPATVHALCHVINVALGNAGQTVLYSEPIEVEPLGRNQAFVNLVKEMNAGQVGGLICIDCNPVFSAAGDLEFKEALKKVKFSAHYGLYDNETSVEVEWRLPATHFLEHWSDARAFDGTASIVQPLISPIYDGRSPHEVLSMLAGIPAEGLAVVMATWKKLMPNANFQKNWNQWLASGVIPNTTNSNVMPGPTATLTSENKIAEQKYTVLFRPDPTLDDGEHANNGWLQECPKPITTLTWDNTAQMSPKTAEELGIGFKQGKPGSPEDGNSGGMSYWYNVNMVRLTIDKQSVVLPVWILPGQPDGVITIHFGYGRTVSGRIGKDVGQNIYPLRKSNAMWMATGVKVEHVPGNYPIAPTQHHQRMEGRNLVSVVNLAEYIKDPKKRFEEEEHVPPISMYDGKEFEWNGQKWGMTIDLNTCTGCSACMIACQAENNIPVVGKREVISQRKMHWIRIDRYYEGELNDPKMVIQPVTCMQCEQAPCEPVCPVAATVHSMEGLNQMVYNRCIGTRYCSNNCPYKVRRFNFLRYSDLMANFDQPQDTRLLKMLNNPNVTVRYRGVMEKCTYCVQRINEARIAAKKEGRHVKDGEVITACQQACPTKAITFGDIADKETAVAKKRALPRNYTLLPELNTINRTTYLGRVRNPNPELEKI